MYVKDSLQCFQASGSYGQNVYQHFRFAYMNLTSNFTSAPVQIVHRRDLKGTVKIYIFGITNMSVQVLHKCNFPVKFVLFWLFHERFPVFLVFCFDVGEAPLENSETFMCTNQDLRFNM